MSDKEEKISIGGHSPAIMVGGMRVSKPNHPVSLTEEKSNKKLSKQPREFLETNRYSIPYGKR